MRLYVKLPETVDKNRFLENPYDTATHSPRANQPPQRARGVISCVTCPNGLRATASRGDSYSHGRHSPLRFGNFKSEMNSAKRLLCGCECECECSLPQVPYSCDRGLSGFQLNSACGLCSGVGRRLQFVSVNGVRE